MNGIKKIWIFLLLVSVFWGMNALDVGAQGSSKRQELIQQELNCISQHVDQRLPLDWTDICYSRSQKEANMSSGIIKPLYPSAPQEYPAEGLGLKEHASTLGMEISHISYEEPIFNLVEDGIMIGFYGEYTYRPANEDGLLLDVINMYRVDGKFSYGQVDYSSTPSGTIDDIDNYLFEIRGVFGRDFLPNEDLALTPYFGFGYRRLLDDGGGRSSSTNAKAYDRIANYFYMPFGADGLIRLSSDWLLGANVEWDLFLGGKQESHLSDASSSLGDLENDQDSGFGVRGSLKIIKQAEMFHLVFEPFIRYWHIDNSKLSRAVGPTGIVVTGYEPENKSTEYGVKLGVQF